MPTVKNRSCSRAMSAAAAIVQVRKYNASRTETNARKTNSATIALCVTVSPHEGPMNEDVTLLGETPNSFARDVLTASVASAVPSPSFSLCTRIVSEPSFVTTMLAFEPVADWTAFSARVS